MRMSLLQRGDRVAFTHTRSLAQGICPVIAVVVFVQFVLQRLVYGYLIAGTSALHSS